MTRSSNKRSRTHLTTSSTLAAVVLALLVSNPLAPAHERNPNPGILPIRSEPFGKSYGEWAAAWWQWALSIPADHNPVSDKTGRFFSQGQCGPVWFRGAFGSSGERTSIMPEGKALFMPVYNWLFGAGVFDCDPTVPGVPCDVPTLRALAAANTEAATVLDVTIDGVAVKNVRAYRAASPEPFSVTYPENSVVGVAAGTYYPQVTDGYWLMLAPLPKGEHTIHIHVLALGTANGTIEFTSVTHLTVVDATLYQAKFDAPVFTQNAPLVGQDGWTAPPVLSPDAAIVAPHHSRSKQSGVHVRGADLVHQDFINEATQGLYDAIGSYRRTVNYDTRRSQSICVSANVRIDGPKSGHADHFFSASIGLRAESVLEGEKTSAGIGELAISSDGQAYAYTGNDNVPIFQASVPVRLGHWHRLAVVADFATETSTFYVDGRLLTSLPFDPNETYTRVVLRGAMLAYAGPDTDTKKKANYVSHYDDFAIKVAAGDCDDDDDKEGDEDGDHPHRGRH